MGLTSKTEERLKKMPHIETSVRTSQDGKFVIYRTTITDIKPKQYLQKVLEGSGEDVEASTPEAAEA